MLASYGSFKAALDYLSSRTGIQTAPFELRYRGKDVCVAEFDGAIDTYLGWAVSQNHLLLIHPGEKVPIVGQYRLENRKRIEPVSVWCEYHPNEKEIRDCPLRSMMIEVERRIEYLKNR